MTSPSMALRLTSRPAIIPPALFTRLLPANRSRRLPASTSPLLTRLLPAWADRLLLARNVPTLSRLCPAIRLRLLPAIKAPLGASRLFEWARYSTGTNTCSPLTSARSIQTMSWVKAATCSAVRLTPMARSSFCLLWMALSIRYLNSCSSLVCPASRRSPVRATTACWISRCS
ncbi:hypothetical protein D3C78_1241160 [compost metagenome]